MAVPFRPFRTGSDADLAFAVVVLAAYFTTFSTLRSTSSWELLLMIGLGVAYIATGIYGYAFVARSGRLALHLAYFGTQLLLGGGIVALGRGAGYNALVLLPLAGHSVMLLPDRWRLVINISIIAVYSLALESLTGGWAVVWAGLPVFLAGQIFIVVFTQMAVSEEQARGSVEALVRELEAANQRLRAYALQADELATSRERNRMAREIHDGLGHYLTTVFMQVQAARAVMKADPQRAYDAMGTALTLTQEALADVRHSVAALRDRPGTAGSLPEEIEKLLRSCEAGGLQTQLQIVGPQRPLANPTLMTLYRAAQEGINNTTKHARARLLSITLDYTSAEQVRLAIQDDGSGADHTDGGFGLLGMRERVQMLDGSLSIDTQPGAGFRLEICVPG